MMGVLEPMLKVAASKFDTQMNRLVVLRSWKSCPESSIDDRLSLKVPHGGKDFDCSLVFDEDDITFLDVIVPEFSRLGFRSHPKTLESWNIDDPNSLKTILFHIKDSLTAFCAKKDLPKNLFCKMLTRLLKNEDLICDYEIISHKSGCRILMNLEFGEDCRDMFDCIVLLEIREPYEEIDRIQTLFDPDLTKICEKIPEQSKIQDCRDVQHLQDWIQMFVMSVQSVHSAGDHMADDESDFQGSLEARTAFLSAMKAKFNDACSIVDSKDYLNCEVKIQVEKVQFSFKIQLENNFPKSRPIFHSSALDLTENATVTLEDFKVEKDEEAMALAKHIFDDTIPHLVKALFLKLGYHVQPPT